MRKRAKSGGWQRDLTFRVQEQVRSELVRTPVRTPYARDEVRTEREIVEAAAATVGQVLRLHRRNIGQARGLAQLVGTRDDERRAAVRQSIAEHGVQTPIVIFDGQVLDGWHRYSLTREPCFARRVFLFQAAI